jgi:SNF2 family DNA or RNA helicase
MNVTVTKCERYVVLPDCFSIDDVSSIAGRSKAGTEWRAPLTPFVCLSVVRLCKKLGVTKIDDRVLNMSTMAANAKAGVVMEDNDPKDDNYDRFGNFFLRKHQTDAIKFLVPRHGAMLASDMGTGKTLVALALASARECKRVLVTAPLSVVDGSVWSDQVNNAGLNHCIDVLELCTGTVAKRVKEMEAFLAEDKDRMRVVVINYDSVWREPFLSSARKIKWDMIAADESHRIKGAGSRVSTGMYLLGMSAQTRLCMTGTPMPESPLDLYGQFRFIDVGVFGSKVDSFNNEYAEYGGYMGYEIVRYINKKRLTRKMNWLSFRVDDSVTPLPETSNVVRKFSLSAKAKKVHDSINKEMMSSLGNMSAISVSNALGKILRMQECTSGYAKDDDGNIHNIDDGRQSVFEDILNDISVREPIVVFYQFVQDRLRLKRALKKSGRKFSEVRGGKKTLHRWKAGKSDVLLVQISSGAEGLDLTRAKYSIFYTLNHKLRLYEQARKRTHRPGQTRSCVYIHIVASATIDVDIYAALREKKSIVSYMLDKKLLSNTVPSLGL